MLLEEHVSSMYSLPKRQSSNYVRNKTFLISGIFWAVALSRNGHIRFVKSVRLSVLLSNSTGRISVKFDIGRFYEYLSINYTSDSNLIKNIGHFTLKIRIFLRFFIVAVDINSS